MVHKKVTYANREEENIGGVQSAKVKSLKVEDRIRLAVLESDFASVRIAVLFVEEDVGAAL